MAKSLVAPDNRPIAPASGPTPPGDFDFSQLSSAPPPPKPEPATFGARVKRLLRAMMGRTLGSLFWHAFFALVFSPMAIISGVGFVAATIAALVGWKMTAPDAEKKKAEPIRQKIEARADALIEKPRVVAPAAVAGSAAGGAAAGGAAVARAAKELAERHEREKREKLEARAHFAGLVVDAAWSTERLRMEVERAEARKTLLDRAEVLGMKVEAAWDNPRLSVEIDLFERKKKHEEAWAKYQHDLDEYKKAQAHAPNGNCPRCRNPLRIGPNQAKRQCQCPKCLYFFQGSRAIAMHTPPRPPKPPSDDDDKKKGLLERFFK